jgi:hypothetical protein
MSEAGVLRRCKCISQGSITTKDAASVNHAGEEAAPGVRLD